MNEFKLKRFSKPKYAELPGASPFAPSLGLCPGPTGGLTALCRHAADFFMSSEWEMAFGLLQTQFGTQKRWYDTVFGKTPEFALPERLFLFLTSSTFSAL